MSDSEFGIIGAAADWHGRKANAEKLNAGIEGSDCELGIIGTALTGMAAGKCSKVERKKEGSGGGRQWAEKGRRLRRGGFATHWRASLEIVVGRFERCHADYLRFATVSGPSGGGCLGAGWGEFKGAVFFRTDGIWQNRLVGEGKNAEWGKIFLSWGHGWKRRRF